MVAIISAGILIAVLLLSPDPAFAWGPITHVALGIRALATVITPDHELQAALLGMPEVFLYGSLAPDIVQGRRLQSRLRRHSHNWATGTHLLDSARGREERAFALGYLAHLAADVVAHNFFLPSRFIGRFDSAIANHIYAEARFDSFQPPGCRDLLVKLTRADFSPLHGMLDRAVDSPLVPFEAHRRIFEGGLKRIRQFDRVMRALGGPDAEEVRDVDLFTTASCGAVEGLLRAGKQAPAMRFDAMGTQAIRRSLSLRRNLRRLSRISQSARGTARKLSTTMVADLRTHLEQAPFEAHPR